MGRRPKATHTRLMKAIQGSDGNISIIAKRLGVSWSVANASLKRDKQAYQLYLDECDKILDICDFNIVEAIKNKDMKVSMWYAERKGAHRGYNPMIKVENEGGSAINVIVHSDSGFEDGEEPE